MTKATTTASLLAVVLSLSLPSLAFAQSKKINVAIAKDGPHHAKATVTPAGTYCSVDGSAFKKADDPIAIITTRQHTIKCSPNSFGKNASDTTIPADFLGKLAASAGVPDDAKKGTKTKVTIRLVDSGGNGVEDVPLTAKADGATLGAIKDEGGGSYAADATYAAGTKSFKLHVEVAGADAIDDSTVSFEAPTPPPPPPPVQPPGSNTPPPAQQPPQPPAPPRVNHIEFGIAGGIGVGSNGVGPNAKVELGVSHTWKPIALAAFVRGGFEKYSKDFDEQDLTLEIPIQLRFGPQNAWFPYLAVVPGLAFDGVTFEGLDGRDVVVVPYIGGEAGAQVKVGPVGFFLELGPRLGNVDHQTGGGSRALTVFQTAIGARIAL